MKEREFQKVVIHELTQMGCFTLKVHGGLMQKIGMPDIYVSHKLVEGWIELKVGTAKLKTIQRLRIKQIKETNTVCLVLRSHRSAFLVEDEDGHFIVDLQGQIKGLIGIMLQYKKR